jgi:Ras-related protein Rab-6A
MTDRKINLVVFGSGAVGKSVFIRRYTKGFFDPRIVGTIGVDCACTSVEIDGSPYRFVIWDTPGNEKFRAMNEAYLSYADGILLLCEVTVRHSFNAFPSWYESIERRAKAEIPVVICATKVDLPGVLSLAEVEEFAASKNAPFFAVSAQTGEGVNEAFEEAARLALARLRGPPPPPLGPPTYHIYIRIISASGLKTRLFGWSDVGLVFNVEGLRAKTMSRFVKNDSNPNWDEIVVVEGYFVGNDVVNVLVYDRSGSKRTKVIGGSEILIREIELGVTVFRLIELFRVDSTCQIDKKSKPGSAGHLKVELSLQRGQNAAFVDSPWSCPFHDASIKILNVTDWQSSSGFFFIEVSLIPSPNGQKAATKSVKSGVSMVFDEQLNFVIGNYDVDCFKVLIRQKRSGAAVANHLIPVKLFGIGSGWMEKKFEMCGDGTLMFCGVLDVIVRVDGVDPVVFRATDSSGGGDRSAADGGGGSATRAEVNDSEDGGVKPISGWIKDFNGMRTMRKIGEGAFGVVTLVEDPSTQDQIAVKSIEMNTMGGCDKSELFVREVEMLIRLTHPCVVRIVGYSLPTSTSPGQIGTKFAVNGSLRCALDARRSGSCPSFLDATGVSIILTGLVIGMKFIHSHGVIHRDLKPGNIVIDEHGWPQIGDLGSSRLASLDITLTRDVGTPLYTAPEMYDECEYTSAIDVYSFSLIAYELLVGEYVFPPTISRLVLMKQSLGSHRPPLPELMHPRMKRILRLGWSSDASVRPSFETIFLDFESMNFDVTGQGNSSRLHDFVSHVRGIESRLA